jgi:ribosomal protein S18 acetylase RimI-like enzyme
MAQIAESQIAEPLRPVRILAKPKRYAPLKTFNCSRSRNHWEATVQIWAKNAYLGVLPDPQTVVALEDADGRLVGAGGFRKRPLMHPEPEKTTQLAMEAYYIHMLATDRLYQGVRLQDGLRPGDVLLQGMLRHIKSSHGGSMPCVWVLTSPKNTRSAALFDRNGFVAFPYPGEGEVVRFLTSDGRDPFASPRKGRRFIRQFVRAKP